MNILSAQKDSLDTEVQVQNLSSWAITGTGRVRVWTLRLNIGQPALIPVGFKVTFESDQTR
jgi:hypothetical protein